MEEMKIYKKGDNIPEHPLFSVLKTDGPIAGGTVIGYVGPAPKNDRIRLYRNLDSLSDFVEVMKEDILFGVDIPESVLPYGATKLWLKRQAEVIFSRTATEGASAKLPASVTELRQGRLRIRMRSRPLREEPVCQSSCSVCASICTCTEVCEFPA